MSNIIKKYKSLPIQVKAAFWFTVCSAVQSGCKFLAMPVLVRLLTTEEYGIYSVFLSWIQIVSLFATLNMHCGVFNNAMFRFPDDRSRYTSSAQSVSISATFVCLVIYLLFHNYINELFGLPGNFSMLIFIQLLFTEGFPVWSSRQRYEYRYVSLIAYTSVLSVLYLVFPILAGYIYPPEKRLEAVIYTGTAVQVLFGLGFIIYNYIKGKCFYNKEYWKFALSFNIPLIPHYLSGIILGQADRVMIKNQISSAAAGIYSFTYNISIVMNIITQAVNNAIVPYTYEKIKARDFKKLSSITNFLLIMLGVMVFMFSAIAPEFIRIFATEEYYEAVYLVPVISLSSYFTFLYCLFANVEFYFEKNKFITVASVIGAAANVILNYLLLPVFGYYAAGYTTLFCYILFSVSHYIFMRIVCREKIDGERVYNGKHIFVISVTVVFATIGLTVLYNHILIRYCLLAAAVVICVIKRKTIVNNLKMIKEKKS